jgi:hypothetical protein
MHSMPRTRRSSAASSSELRYRFANEEWWDTLTHTASGVRLIRISHTRALAGVAIDE